MNVKQGDSVRVILQGIDGGGEVISETTSTWYGFDTATANEMEVRIVEQLLALIRTLSDDKTGGKK